MSTPSSVDLSVPPQPGFLTLTSPKWRSAWNRFRRAPANARPGRGLLLGLAAFLFFAIAFWISWRVVNYFRNVPEIGHLLAAKLLAVALLAFSSILLVSNLVSALSTFFLAKDLDMLVASPVDWGRFYLAKLAETIVHSSWMVGLLSVPLMLAYGMAWHGGPLFPLVAIGALLPLAIVPAVIGVAVTLLLVNIFPARRARDVLGLLSVAGVGVVFILARVAQPEQLARPEGFRSLIDFIAVLRTPSHPLLPSEWASAMIMNWLTRTADPLPIALLWTTALAFIVMGAAVHLRLYAPGLGRAREGADQFVRGTWSSNVVRRLLGRMDPMHREFILKDLRIFFRDSTQWSQLILVGVLVMVILFNIQALPLNTGEQVPVFLITLIAFLNQGLTGFVIAAVAARFIFPSLSLEGRQLWLLRSSPLDPRAMLRSKYLVGVAPLVLLAFALTVTTNLLLQASLFMIVMGGATVVGYTLAIGGLALGIGTLYPQYDSENAAQIPTSFGGLVFMLLAIALLGLVIVLEVWPVTEYLRSRQQGGPGTISLPGMAALLVAALSCAAAGLIPLRLAVRRIESLEA